MAKLYIKSDDVKVRVVGKVRFTDDPNDESGKMPIKLLDRLIAEAEGQVESDLSQRYAAPFQTADGTAFANLPERPTKEIIRTLCELKAVMRVLETEFGAVGPIDGDKYYLNVKSRYKTVLESLLEITPGTFRMWVKPPLPSLRLNAHNTEADDGYAGQIFNTSVGDGDYPRKQINDPSENFWNGDIDE